MFERKIRGLLARAGITVNGDKPYDIQVHNNNFYRRVLLGRDVGVAESYIDGYYDCDRIDEFIYRLLAHIDVRSMYRWSSLIRGLLGYIINAQSLRRATSEGKSHYEAGNDLFQAMLDKHMIYSCGYWRGAKSLEQAQENKLDLIARKLQLEKGMHILDVGCGWGGGARYLSRKYGVRVTGITVAQNQYEWAKQWCKDDNVNILLSDYRHHQGSYDAIYSIGMLEHVGAKNYRTYTRVMERNLKPGGQFLLHTIGTHYTLTSAEYRSTWIGRNIFINGELPSQKNLIQSLDGLFILDDWHNFGIHYDKTLMAWSANFDSAYPSLKDRYDERFYRRWHYYLLSCAGVFRARHAQLWQLLLTRGKGRKTPFEPPRCS